MNPSFHGLVNIPLQLCYSKQMTKLSPTVEYSPLKRNFRLFYTVNFFQSAHFSLPIGLLFGVEYLGVSYLQAGALFLVSWVVSLCFDFLTGTIADKYGRKKIFVIGMVLQLLSMLPYVITKNYGVLVCASVIAGIGMALVSNTLNALLYEQAKEQKKLKYYQHANAVANACMYGGRILASIIGGVAYLAHPVLPYGLTVIGLVLALIAGMYMHFSKRVEERAENETHLKIMKTAWRIFLSNVALIKFTIVITLISVWGDYIFNVYQPFYIEEHGVSSVILGYIFAGISVLSAAGSIAMRHLPNRFSVHAVNTLTLTGIAITASLLTILPMPAVYVAPIGLAIVSGFSIPNLNLYINKHAPSNIRSSVLSIATTATGLGSGVGIIVVLQLVTHVPFWQITTGCLVGCILTILANSLFKAEEKST